MKRPQSPSKSAGRESGRTMLVVMALLLIGALGYVLVPGNPTEPVRSQEVNQPVEPLPGSQALQAIPSQTGEPLSPTTAPAPKAGAKGPLPPLPFNDYAAARAPDVVRAVYEFAARRPDVLQYVPCFCGCERFGHLGNDDCFVASRDAEGNVTWDTHGMG